MAPRFVLAIDQGTTSSRAILFDHSGIPRHTAQAEFPQYYPKEGWAEHDPLEILKSVQEVVQNVLEDSKVGKEEVAAIGITNQRETTLAWDKVTGEPLSKALVWLDMRTADLVREMEEKKGKDAYREKTGLPLSTYFSAMKIRWIMDNVEGVKEAVEEGRGVFGTVDSWLVYSLSKEKPHLTDVSNASRYMLMSLSSLSWDPSVCADLGIPIDALPSIRSNSEILATFAGSPLEGVPIASLLGDQHAALLGQGCIEEGLVKNTYGTGCFMLMNTGPSAVPSSHGLLSTIGFQLDKTQPPVYALEGAIACAGRGVQWLRDQLSLFSSSSDIEVLAASVPSSGGVTFVPAFSGLFAPHWRSDARAVVCGMTLGSSKGHLCRALLEGVALQVCEVVEAMERDSKIEIKKLMADGGMSTNQVLMSLQADLLGKQVCPAKMPESTALGVAFAAGLAVGFWGNVEEIKGLIGNQGGHGEVYPQMGGEERGRVKERWADAVRRSFDLEKFQS